MMAMMVMMAVVVVTVAVLRRCRIGAQDCETKHGRRGDRNACNAREHGGLPTGYSRITKVEVDF